MPVPLIPIALSLASQFLPSLVGKLMGDNAEKVAEGVVNVAQLVTGTEDADGATAAIRNNPELALKFQEGLREYELGLYREDTKRLTQINETMRAEISSSDRYVRRWRPTFGYAVAITWAIQGAGLMFVSAWAVIKQPVNAGSIISAIGQMLGAMSSHWWVALTVLGVSVARRSRDKQVATTGTAPAGIVETLTGLFKNKG